MPSSLHTAVAFLDLFSVGGYEGQSKVFCQENMLLVMMSWEMREETGRQAVTACVCVCMWEQEVLPSLCGAICCTELRFQRCSAEPGEDGVMCLHGLGSKCRRRKGCLQLLWHSHSNYLWSVMDRSLRASFMLGFSKPGQESCNNSIWYGIANRNLVQGKDRQSSAL